jgi:hydrogenase nickel insertion protein HypA
MHELPITENILKISLEEAKKYDAKKISRINIKMGALSELLPECINYYFEIISKNTIAEGAVLNIEKIPLKIECTDCSNISEISIRSFRCPVCGSQKLKIIKGNEFYINSLEVD